MKHISHLILICMVFAIQESMLAQDTYRPFVEEGKEWQSSFGSGMARQYIGKDTLIAGQQWKIWMQQERVLPEIGFPTVTEEYYKLYVYEQDKKVWFLFDCETSPRLFFDFGAGVGDTLEVAVPSAYTKAELDVSSKEYGYDLYERWWTARIVIQDIQPVNILGHQYSRFYYSYQSPGMAINSPDYWPNYHQTYITEAVGGHFYAHEVLPIDINSYASCMDYCRVSSDVLYCRSDFNIYDVIEGVETPHQVSQRTSALFDLTGRRLSAPPTRGLYIEDGKIKGVFY